MCVHVCIRQNITFTYAEGSNLPIALVTKRKKISKANFAGKNYFTAASSGKINISKAQEELTFWHGILVYHNIADTQKLIVGKDMDKLLLIIPKHSGNPHATFLYASYD